MDFFERQDQARHSTRWLILYFGLAVISLVGATYFAVAALLLAGGPGGSFWDPETFLTVTVGTLAIIGVGSLSKTMELSQGGRAVATMLGGELINSDTRDADERKLLNIVEEMALASGVPVPPVYVLREEGGINAFAAGRSLSDAVIGVTRGGMKLLTRDELQGVIGHEFSHILNGDMRLNLRLMGIIFGIVCLATAGRVLLRLRSRGRSNPLPALGLALVVIGALGAFFGRLIQAAVSRQREFLADASAVQFTRNPAGLAGALKKIGGLDQGSRLESPHAVEALHSFFGNGLGESWFGLMSTHPPLEERIRLLDPAFDGLFPEVTLVPVEPKEPARPKRSPSFAGIPPRVEPFWKFKAVESTAALANLGAPTAQHLKYAAGWSRTIAPALDEAAREPFSACGLIYALLLSPNDETREAQGRIIAVQSSMERWREVELLAGEVASLPASGRLALIDLSLPALRRLSRVQYGQWSQLLRALIECDRQIDLFEFVLQRALRRHLAPEFEGAPNQVIQYYAIAPLRKEMAVLLSAVAHAGHDQPAQIETAFRQGLGGIQLADPPRLLASEECGLDRIDAALQRLANASPQLKKFILQAVAQTAAADGLIQEREAELLRAIADSLDCPIPPYISR